MDLLSIPYLVQHLCSLIVAHLTELAQARRYLGLRGLGEKSSIYSCLLQSIFPVGKEWWVVSLRKRTHETSLKIYKQSQQTKNNNKERTLNKLRSCTVT